MTTSIRSFAITGAALSIMMAGPPVHAQAPGAATKAVMTAKLIDADKKAAEKAATVEVTPRESSSSIRQSRKRRQCPARVICITRWIRGLW